MFANLVFEAISEDKMRNDTDGSFLVGTTSGEPIVLAGSCALNVRMNEDARSVFGASVHVASAPNDGGTLLS